MEITGNNLVRVARRDNNKKRGYLVVNPAAAKHVPASPSAALGLFGALADLIRERYHDERLLLVGFAETATAIGAATAVSLEAPYIQTTREIIPGAGYLYFSEEHSHATEQKLVRDQLDDLIPDTDRIVFVEDEVTTGNTILNIISIMEKTWGDNIRFTAASLLNGMKQEHIDNYAKRNVDLIYLLKTDHSGYEQIASESVCDGKQTVIRYAGNAGNAGNAGEEDPTTAAANNGVAGADALTADATDAGTPVLEFSGGINARKLTDGKSYGDFCRRLWDFLCHSPSTVISSLSALPSAPAALPSKGAESILVLGTEEFMYPAIYVASMLEETGCHVRTHSTTRSPILVSTREDYPLHERYELPGVYDANRRTFIYDIDRYDRVFIITDAPDPASAGMACLTKALREKNRDISIIHVCY